MKYMKTILNISVLSILLVVAPSLCSAMMEIEDVSKARAKELGMEIRSNAAGPAAVRVELEFETKGALKSFSRVDLEFRDGGKSLMTSSLKEDRSKPGRVVVSFAVDRANLDKITMRVVVQPAPLDMVGHEIRVRNFVDLENLR